MSNTAKARIIVGYGQSFAVMVADDALKAEADRHGLFNVFGIYVKKWELTPGDYVLTFKGIKGDFRRGTIKHEKLEPTMILVGLPSTNAADPDAFAEEWACLDEPTEPVIRTKGRISKDKP